MGREGMGEGLGREVQQVGERNKDWEKGRADGQQGKRRAGKTVKRRKLYSAEQCE